MYAVIIVAVAVDIGLHTREIQQMIWILQRYEDCWNIIYVQTAVCSHRLLPFDTYDRLITLGAEVCNIQDQVILFRNFFVFCRKAFSIWLWDKLVKFIAFLLQ